MREEQWTKNFKGGEWLVSAEFPDLAKKLDPNVIQVERMRMITTYFHQPLRDHLGRVVISSGYRDFALNEAVEGHVSSHHMQLMNEAACDIVVPGMTPREVVAEYLKMSGIMRCSFLLIYSNFVHVSFGPWPQINEVRYKR